MNNENSTRICKCPLDMIKEYASEVEDIDKDLFTGQSKVPILFANLSTILSTNLSPFCRPICPPFYRPICPPFYLLLRSLSGPNNKC